MAVMTTYFNPLRLLLVTLTAFFVLAQPGGSQAACLGSGANLAPDALAKLQANPASIFLNAQGAPLGNAELISKIRDLVTSDKAALKLVTEALKLASADEKSAIGTALGQAAQACLTTDAGYSADIQEALAASTDQTAILAFSAVTGNVPIGAAGGGAGGGGAGGGAGGGTSGSGAASGTGGTGTGGGVGGGGVTGTTLTNISTTGTTTISVTSPTTGANAAVSTTVVSVSP